MLDNVVGTKTLFINIDNRFLLKIYEYYDIRNLLLPPQSLSMFCAQRNGARLVRKALFYPTPQYLLLITLGRNSQYFSLSFEMA